MTRSVNTDVCQGVGLETSLLLQSLFPSNSLRAHSCIFSSPHPCWPNLLPTAEPNTILLFPNFHPPLPELPTVKGHAGMKQAHTNLVES